MLSKKYRLSKVQISKVYQKGISHKLGLVGMKTLPNDAPNARFAVVVSQKIAKKAVTRNRLRRLIFTEIGEILKKPSLKIQNRDCVIRLFHLPENEASLKTQIKELVS